MGVRYSKRLGYGFASKDETALDKIREDSVFHDWINGKPTNLQWDDLLKYAKSFKPQTASPDTDQFMVDVFCDDLERSISGNKPHSFYKHMAAHGEFTKFSIYLFTPLGYLNDWYSHDNSIDYVELELSNNTASVDNYDIVPHGFFPYNSYIRKDTLEVIKQPLYVRWRREAEEKGNFEEADKLLKPLGFATHEEINELVVNKPSIEATVFYSWLEAFKDPKEAYLLQPLIYRCWD